MKLQSRDAKDRDAPRYFGTSSFEHFYRSERDALFASLCLTTRDPHEVRSSCTMPS